MAATLVPSPARTPGTAASSSPARRSSTGPPGDFRVAVRVRPLTSRESARGDEAIVTVIPPPAPTSPSLVSVKEPQYLVADPLRHHVRAREFAFDVVFGPSSSQEQIFSETTQPMLGTVLAGYNVSIFAYGCTSAGKTYTMLGSAPHNVGIIPRTVNALFEMLNSRRDELSVSVRLGYVEVYNEQLRDLLDPARRNVQLREGVRGISIANLSEISIESADQIESLLQKGNLNRTEAPTSANPLSSRSHAVCQIVVETRPRLGNVTIQVTTSKLTLVDLAGSERASSTDVRHKSFPPFSLCEC